MSRIFHPCNLVPKIHVSHFPPLHFWPSRIFMSRIFSRPAGTNSSRPGGGLHWRRYHHECSRHCSRQSMFCSTPSNMQCASFANTYTLLTLVHALVVTKVDYCSSVLSGISGQLLQRLQSVFNAAARLVFSAGKSEHITPLLRELHWLKVPERIQFRLCV